MLREEELEGFYPRLTSRILLYLRQQFYEKQEILTEDLIEHFGKSKSIISQALSFLSKHHYIKRRYVKNVDSHGSRHKISIAKKGIEVVEALLFEGLFLEEKKALKKIKKRMKARIQKDFEYTLK
jgi:DNA-binding MarR family transcriptional regulator